MRQFPFILLLILFVSCVERNANNQVDIQESISYETENKIDVPPAIDPFFEGVVTPGCLTAKHYDTTNAANLVYTIYDEITINEDHTFIKREKTTGLYNDRVQYRTFRGRIMKYKETYNGKDHVWFAFNGVSDDKWISSFSIETDGVAIKSSVTSYSEFYDRKTSSLTDDHWMVRHKKVE